MKNQRVFVTDLVHEILIEGLKEMGFIVDYAPKVSLEEVRRKASKYYGLVINSKIIVDDQLLNKAPDLCFVARLGSGLDIIDLPACKRHGVEVLSSPKGNCNAVAEHVLGMLFALSNNLLRAHQQVRQHQWNREAMRGWEIRGKVFGIIGVGNTGGTLLKKLGCMDLKSVLTYDKYLPAGYGKTAYSKEADLDEVIRKSDIISLHLPLTTETKGMVNEDFLSKMKKGSVLINTSRGAVVRTSALLKALESRHLRGACLDVFENEKTDTYSMEEYLKYNRLFAMPNVLLSPHVAGWTVESKFLLARILLDKIQALSTN